MKLILQDRRSFIIAQGITLIAIIVSVPIPLMLPVLVDEVLLDKPAHFVNTIDSLFGSGNAFYYIAIVAFAVIFLRFFHFILNVIVTKIFTRISKYVTFYLRQTLLTHLSQVSMNEYETLGNGAISSNLVTDINTLDQFLITAASRFIAALLSLIAISVVMIAIHPILGLMILLIQPLIMYISKKISKSVVQLKSNENQAIEKFQDNLSEVLELFGQIKASNKEHYFFEQSIQKAKNIQTTSNTYNYKSVAYERFSFTIFLAAFEILRATGLLMVAYSDLSIGMMFAMFGYIWFIMTPIQDILSMQYSYASAKAAIKRLNIILELQKEPQGNKTICNDCEVDITLHRVCFSYVPNKEVLNDISLQIAPQSKIALIGASGSGKTTLAQLIAGFYHKTSGAIMYNGINSDEIDKRSLRNAIFLVLQMPILFNNTLRFNLTMGDETVTQEQINHAIRMAQLQEVVDALPQNLETRVGKNGVRLSGGQRQRLSIARMIIADPSVVIFDESTSALDVHTETKLFKALESFLKNKTVITIAHRLSTVKNANTVFVLNEGKIVQQGTHKELEQQEGHYTQFVKNQLV